MIDPDDLRRMKAILRKEATGWATEAEQEELYVLVDKYTGKARSLPWTALVEVAQWGVRMFGQDARVEASEAAA